MTEKALAKTEGQATELAVRRESAGFAASVLRETGTIAGVDDTNQHRYRFPRLGKIHLGIKKPLMKKQPDGTLVPVMRNGPKGQEPVEYPSATDYFVLPDVLLQDVKFMDALSKCNADPKLPRCLPVRMITHNILDNMRSSLDFYGATHGLKCRSYDGLTTQCVDEKSGEMVTKPCTNVKCEHYLRGECHVISRLRFFLPDAKGVGVYQLDTCSPNNRANLPCEMQTIRAATGNKLAGIDLQLVLEAEQKIITEKKKGVVQLDDHGNAKKLPTTVWLLHLRTDLNLRELIDAAEHVTIDYQVDDVEDADTAYDEVVMEHEPESADFQVGEDEAPAEPEGMRDELTEVCVNLLEALFPTPQGRRAATRGILKVTICPELRDVSIDQLLVLKEALELRAANTVASEETAQA
jgi:hypothetical protein